MAGRDGRWELMEGPLHLGREAYLKEVLSQSPGPTLEPSYSPAASIPTSPPPCGHSQLQYLPQR